MGFTKEQLLEFAARAGNVDLVKERMVDGADARLSKALLVAVQEGHLGVVELLLEHGADINSIDDRGYGPLEYALRWNRLDVARLLLTRGADVPHHSRSHWKAQIDQLRKDL